MRIVSATVYALRIPFVEAFAHSARERSFSDSVVVRVVDDAGFEGWGEGAPRPYVTGETVDFMLGHLVERLCPRLLAVEIPPLAGPEDLPSIDALIPEAPTPVVLSDGASRAALEIAVLDCALRRADRSLGALLPPARKKVVYSGVITAGPRDKVAEHARRMRLIGLHQIKIKVGIGDDLERVRSVRDVLPEASLRVDANGAWTPDEAARMIEALAPFGIAAVEQPLPRGELAPLCALRRRSPVPLMVDESLVTIADAEALIAAGACDLFNVRISKCGGLARSRAIARRAVAAGIQVQIGSQVGETAILSAAGRHLAASIDPLAFAEGSFGALLLSEDVSVETVRFGHRGEASLLRGTGLGIRVIEERLRKYAAKVVAVPSAG